MFIQAATAAALLLAANTSYNDFPRVLFLMARDSSAPRSFLCIGNRLTFRNGIIALSLIAAVIYAVSRGNTESLIPLYAVGVFLAFTMSQAGMVVLPAPPRPAALAAQPGLQRHRRQRPDLTLTVILPEIVVRHWWHRPLHNHTASRLQRALRALPKVVVTTVPVHLTR